MHIRFPRAGSDDGQGLIELIAALTMLAIAVGALLSILVGGALAVQRASQRGTAFTLAEKQLEVYRTLGFNNIRLDSGCINALYNSTSTVAACGIASSDSSLKAPGNTDPYFTAAGMVTGNAITTAQAQQVVGLAAGTPSLCSPTNPVPVECRPVQLVSAGSSPDHRPYRIDTYIASLSTSGRQTKQVWVVVRDPSKVTRPILAQNASSFDQSVSATG